MSALEATSGLVLIVAIFWLAFAVLIPWGDPLAELTGGRAADIFQQLLAVAGLGLAIGSVVAGAKERWKACAYLVLAAVVAFLAWYAWYEFAPT